MRGASRVRDKSWACQHYPAPFAPYPIRPPHLAGDGPTHGLSPVVQRLEPEVHAGDDPEGALPRWRLDHLGQRLGEDGRVLRHLTVHLRESLHETQNMSVGRRQIRVVRPVDVRHEVGGEGAGLHEHHVDTEGAQLVPARVVDEHVPDTMDARRDAIPTLAGPTPDHLLYS